MDKYIDAMAALAETPVMSVGTSERAKAALRRPTAIELFAGVGGFHLALHGADIDVVWANQWEPATKTQHAAACLVSNIEAGKLGAHEVVPYDIERVLDEAIVDGIRYLPKVDVVVGGFPCQDYSVAKPLSQASGIVGKKGVLWWQIHRLLEFRRPSFFFLENVDRLLKSPSTQPRPRLRDHVVVGRWTRVLGRMARRERRGLRVPAEASAACSWSVDSVPSSAIPCHILDAERRARSRIADRADDDVGRP